MSSSSHSFDMLSIRRLLRGLTGPRALLIGFATLVSAVLGVFAFVVVDSQAQARREAEQRFRAEATISAELTGSLFTSSAGGTQQAAAKVFGGRTVDGRALAALVARSHLGYAVILDSQGTLLAASPGTPVSVRERRTATANHIRDALAGTPTLSDVQLAVTGRPAIEWAFPFQTRFGRRVEVEALDAQLLFKFFSGYLARTQSGRSARAFQAYVLDSRDRIVGVSGGNAKAGSRPSAPELLHSLAAGGEGKYRAGGVERYFTSAPVAGSTWRVVVNEPTSALYPALAGSRSWLLFAVLGAFGVAGAAGLVFLRRALVSGSRLAEANRRLATMNATLEEQVAERTADAEGRAKELARSNAELEQFASVTSHDLQEPLRKIRMFGDRLKTNLGDDLSDEAASDLKRMQNAAERMQNLISDVLAFSRVTTQGQEFATVDLGKVTEDVLADLEARVIELDARVEVGANLPVIEADKTQMGQLMQNLLSNALKFHRDGERPVIRISSEVVAGHSSRFAGEASAADRCVITVEDNGIGFEEKYSERIFGAFQRLHGRSSYEGTGIGLSIARKIVWRHGGNITVKSALEQGSTFTVTLPLAHQNGHDPDRNGATE